MSYSSEEIYHNCKVLSPDGIEMFRCHRKKFNWYVQKGLAELEPDLTDTIRLKFKPNGLGWAGDHYYLQDRENKCCCCGSSNKLTKHHVVPYCYRREFPEDIKNSNYYDVLPLCIDCHTIYEKYATEKKKNFAERYQAPLQGINSFNEKQASKFARTLIQHGHHIPEDRKHKLIEQIKKETNKQTIDTKELERLAQIRIDGQPEEYLSHSQIVVSKIECFQSFVEEWRNHFVQTMKPEHLPKHWNTKRDLHGRNRR
jgi:exonuclease 3'-5' domain-containing protein 2